MEENATHAHPKHLQHHFENSEQQYESAKIGMWLFLLTEILMFGGLFVAYAVFRAWNPDMFIDAHKQLDVLMGGINTVVLITSSLTMALAIHMIQHNKQKETVYLLAATIALACVFLVIKYFEYSHKIHLGQLPGKFYTFTGIKGSNPHIFFSLYFGMTGLHALHILGGMAVIGWMMVKTKAGAFSAEYYTPIEMTGLFWHLVDLIWIFLFPLFYLIG